MCIVVHAANKKKGLSPLLDFIGGGIGILPNVGNGPRAVPLDLMLRIINRLLSTK